jgi:hypothetical protein
MPLNLTHIEYALLNARQQENYNYQKVSAVLADYGFATLRLTDDWQGADFIAQHVDGERFFKIQLKGRLTFSKKYSGKALYIAFHTASEWYLYPHDELLAVILAETNVAETRSWRDGNEYSFPGLTSKLRHLLAAYKITGSVQPGPENLTPQPFGAAGKPVGGLCEPEA